MFYKAPKSSVCEVQKFFAFIAHLHSVNCHVLENKGLQFYPWWIAITFCGLPRGHYSSHISRLLGVLPSLYGTKHLLTFAFHPNLYITAAEGSPSHQKLAFKILDFFLTGQIELGPLSTTRKHAALSFCIQYLKGFQEHPKELIPRGNILH